MSPPFTWDEEKAVANQKKHGVSFSVVTMKKAPASGKPTDDSDDMLPEYHFDYRKARPNRFAPSIEEGSLIVVLEPDIAQVFTTPEAVKKVLRALIETMPKATES